MHTQQRDPQQFEPDGGNQSSVDKPGRPPNAVSQDIFISVFKCRCRGTASCTACHSVALCSVCWCCLEGSGTCYIDVFIIKLLPSYTTDLGLKCGENSCIGTPTVKKSSHTQQHCSLICVVCRGKQFWSSKSSCSAALAKGNTMKALYLKWPHLNGSRQANKCVQI